MHSGANGPDSESGQERGESTLECVRSSGVMQAMFWLFYWMMKWFANIVVVQCECAVQYFLKLFHLVPALILILTHVGSPCMLTQ